MKKHILLIALFSSILLSCNSTQAPEISKIENDNSSTNQDSIDSVQTLPVETKNTIQEIKSEFKINNKSGEILEMCYHNPCAVSKNITTKIASTNQDQTVLLIKILGGSKDWETDKIKWNDEHHQINIVCSKSKPSINESIITLNENGVSGAMYNEAEMYFNYCHTTKLSVEEAIKEFNYIVKE